jgi:hypothetical protein
VAAGTPLDSDAFVGAEAREPRPSRAWSLPWSPFPSAYPGKVVSCLRRQDKFPVLRFSLQARLTHLTSVNRCSLLSPNVAASARHVLLAALAWMEHPPPTATQLNSVVAQPALPLCSWGFGLRLTTPLQADAPLLVRAGAANVALRVRASSLPAFQPHEPPLRCPHRSEGGGATRCGARPLVPGALGARRAPPRPGLPARPARVRLRPCTPAVPGPADLCPALV